ncbi:peptidase family T4 protein [Apiospora arundinis]
MDRRLRVVVVAAGCGGACAVRDLFARALAAAASGDTRRGDLGGTLGTFGAFPASSSSWLASSSAMTGKGFIMLWKLVGDFLPPPPLPLLGR